MTSFATSKDGTRIAYERTGSGPSLVLVDGALNSRNFGAAKDVATALADSYTVYWYDRRVGDAGAVFRRGEFGHASSPSSLAKDSSQPVIVMSRNSAVKGPSCSVTRVFSPWS